MIMFANAVGQEFRRIAQQELICGQSSSQDMNCDAGIEKAEKM